MTTDRSRPPALLNRMENIRPGCMGGRAGPALTWPLAQTTAGRGQASRARSSVTAHPGLQAATSPGTHRGQGP